MVSGPLSPAQLDDFVERGWTVLERAFSPEIAAAVRRELGRKIGVDLEQPEEWTQPRVWLMEWLTEPPFTDALTDRFSAAVDQLVGAGRWELVRGIGTWPTTFPGFANPPYGNGWHIEGNTFRHRLSSPQQAVLNLFCFSTVEPGGGGTQVVEGSHHRAAELLNDAEPDGLAAEELSRLLKARLDEAGWPEVVEVAAHEGDVVLGHPLLYHSPNPNHGVRPRVMAQPQYRMTEPKRTEGTDLHPVEIPLARARAAARRSI